MFSIFNTLTKRRNKSILKKIIHYSNRKKQISNFVVILDDHIKRVETDQNIRPSFMKLQM